MGKDRLNHSDSEFFHCVAIGIEANQHAVDLCKVLGRSSGFFQVDRLAVVERCDLADIANLVFAEFGEEYAARAFETVPYQTVSVAVINGVRQKTSE